jgi:hypothetical protein
LLKKIKILRLIKVGEKKWRFFIGIGIRGKGESGLVEFEIRGEKQGRIMT